MNIHIQPGPSTDCLCKCERSLIITPILRRNNQPGGLFLSGNMFLIFTSLEKQSATKEKYINTCTAKSKFIANMGPEDQWLSLCPGKVGGACNVGSTLLLCLPLGVQWTNLLPSLALTSPLSSPRDHEDGQRTYYYVCPVLCNYSK